MARIEFTTGTNLAFRLLGIIAGFGIFLIIALIVQSIFKLFLSETEAEIIAVIVAFSAMIGAKIYFLTAFFDTLSSYFYLRLWLGTKVSFKEASLLAFLFVPNEMGTWYSLKEVRTITKGERKAYIFKFASQVLSNW